MSEIYDVDYFIRKFEAIPEELWCVGLYTSGEKRCVRGHCGIKQSYEETAMDNALIGLFGSLQTAENINNGDDALYNQETPRARILAALQYIKNGKVAK